MKRKLGFTLVELVMVIVIIGLLSAIIIPKFADQRAQASISATKANLESLRTAVALYTADFNSPPAIPFTASLVPNYLRAVPYETVISAPPGVNTVTGGTCPATAAGAGWRYNVATGDVCVNTNTADTNGDFINLY